MVGLSFLEMWNGKTVRCRLVMVGIIHGVVVVAEQKNKHICEERQKEIESFSGNSSNLKKTWLKK